MARHYFSWRLAISIVSILAGGMWSAEAALGQYTFVQDTDATGDWNDIANWTDGASNTTYPNAVDATVLIHEPIKTGTGLYTLTLPATDVTVGQITIDDTGYSNTTRTTFANGGGQLIFQSSSGPAKYIETANTGTAPANTQNQIQSNILLNSDLEITQDDYPNLNTGTTFTGIINGDSTKTITKKGAAGIQFNYAFSLGSGEGFSGQYVIQSGAIRLINSSSAIAKSSGVTILSGGQLQLADNAGTAVPDYNLATGAVLNLNGPGKGSTTATFDGALRIGITSPRTTTFHNPVVLQSDSNIDVAATGTFGVLDSVVSGPGDLIKTGSGKLTLIANNTYTGDTQVLGNVLSITNPYLADGADVYLTTGATFDLNFAATDTVRSLYFDNGAQAVGTWGAVGSGATNQSAFFTGTGILNVTTLPVQGDYNGDGKVDAADYVAWRTNPAAHGGDPGGYNTWRSNFGTGAGSGALLAGNVPEPCAMALMLFALLPCAALRRWPSSR